MNRLSRGTVAVGALQVTSQVNAAGNIAQTRTVTNIADGGSMAMTAAGLTGGIVTATLTTPRSISFPTAATIIALIGSTTDATVNFSYINLAAFVATHTVATGTTIVGAATTAASVSSQWAAKVTSSSAVVIYRLS